MSVGCVLSAGSRLRREGAALGRCMGTPPPSLLNPPPTPPLLTRLCFCAYTSVRTLTALGGGKFCCRHVTAENFFVCL